MLLFGRRFSTSSKLGTAAAAKIKNTASLSRPNYDFKAIRAAPEVYQDSVDRRRAKLAGGATIADFVDLYSTLLTAKSERDELLFKRKTIQNQLKNGKRGQEKENGHTSSLDSSEDPRTILSHIKNLLKEREKHIISLEDTIYPLVESIPNLISPDSIIDNQQLVGMIHADKQIPADPTRSHKDIGVNLGILDFDSASRVSGTSSYYLVNDGALLEQALIQYALSKCRQHGWSMLTPPSLVRQEFTTACGFKPRDQNNEQQVYIIADDALNGESKVGSHCLTGTAEIPLAGYNAHKTIPLTENDRPVIRKAGVSRSYRAEAGARGADTKGLYRVHEFSKVEMFAWTTSSDVSTSIKVHEEMLSLQKEILTELGLCCRVLNMPPDDLGAPAYKKYDIEAWMPGRGSWGEVTSTSNCLDYQSRRLHTKYHTADGSLRYAMTLNGTAMAVPRVIIAIIENNYDPQMNRIEIPSVLRKYMDENLYIEYQGPN
ncbi:putative serine--tRNA ligase DIA4 [Sugiyamaella lignohabitans]|uniref:serine--tRNA ligase n=1 Tax=Sugiyamaella lignohabitans TaxID=796027 RepID=A0A170QY06_9ASCO|nr:putative serine--tRNA ligase DIA4 [Sugiyamaella lignohabitans]ANB15961.1 putative serine--tRNA ligase DIA4 [Sugiyamaella lignohabitans]